MVGGALCGGLAVEVDLSGATCPGMEVSAVQRRKAFKEEHLETHAGRG